MTRPEATPNPPSYQVGAFALVRQRDTVLLVRPHKLLLPGGPQSLPGLVLEASSAGMGVVENALRRTLLSQVGISVSDLRLVGSHVLRQASAAGQAPALRMNLIFGTEYCSGILNPQPADLKSALWIAQSQLLGGQVPVPEWLRAALTELQNLETTPVENAAPTSNLSLFGRWRSAEK